MEKRRRIIEEGTDVDRISELPEPILHHIQSLLDLKQAATTSALSKTWNTVWSTLPFLNFDENYFRPRSMCRREDIEANNTKVIAFIDKTLHHRRRQGLRIEQLNISADDVDFYLDLSGHLNHWISRLALCNIDELIIRLPYVKHKILSPSLFTLESLTSLSLKYCKLSCPPIEQVKLPNLRKLSLEGVNIDDGLLHHIFSICHRLEYLLVSCCRIQRLHISGLSNLKILITEHVEDVEVEASNLQELSFRSNGPPPKMNTAYCGNTLKVLTLSRVSIKDDAWFSRLIPILHVLETISLEEFDHNALRISSQSLKHLNICRPRMAFEAEIDTPNLQKFRYEGDLQNFSLKHNLAIGHVVLRLWGSSIDGDRLIKLVQFLHKFNHSKVVKLSIPYYDFEISLEMRKKLLSPFPNVKHFICWSGIPNTTPLSDGVTQVLEGSLCMSSCPEKLFITFDGMEVDYTPLSDYNYDMGRGYTYFDEPFTISLKLMYENEPKEDIEESESCFHCDSIPFRCWRHSLKTVEIEKTGGSYRVDDAVQSVKNYFMANLRSRSEYDVSQLFTERG